MLFFWSLLSLAIGLAASQQTPQTGSNLAELLQSMPSCGLQCLSTAIAASPCLATDTECSCSNATITAEVNQCVTTSCTIREQLRTKNTTETICGHPVRDETRIVSYAGVIGCVIAFVAFVLRMLSKISFPCEGALKVVNNLWWDDAIASFAMAEIIAISVLSVELANLGLGKDIWTLPPYNITQILKIYYFDEDLYLTALPLIKISILLTYLRVFTSKNFKISVYIVIGLNLAYGIAFLLVSIFQCLPIHCAWTRWDGSDPTCKCNDINAQGWTSAAFNVILDVLTLSLPLPMLWKMSLNKRKKFLVMMMFSVGFFVTIVSIIRLQVLVQFGHSQNTTWDYRSVGYWSTIELHASVLCACMPAIRNLIRKFQPRLMGSSVEESFGTKGISAGRSRNSELEIGPKTPQVQVFPRKRDPDEQDFIPLNDVHGVAETTSTGQTYGHRSNMSDFQFFEEGKPDPTLERPVSPLDYRR
ncbi:unnamed protein product [Cercospora beticola]|nr:unnamed protein product [Cercospora beticola]